MSGVKHTQVLIATSSAADGVYVISQGEERKAIGTIRAPRSLVDAMCAAPDLLEAIQVLVTDCSQIWSEAEFPALKQARAAIARARGEQDGGGE